LLIKIAPDLTDIEVAALANTVLKYAIDGIIATNTTLSRAGVENLEHANEQGGLSGAPLSKRATEIVAQLSDKLQGKIPIIAVGGIMSAADAQDKIKAGASLVQIYTGLIYQGPHLVKKISRVLHQSVAR
ncbi:MAG: quinone-dependent dihydroorotate dehydrogenase, partial [Thiomargarita sp.]|nr:quinone-dependent dihydroorotate dehydrogenase [Thiomargarita sp.]